MSIKMNVYLHNENEAQSMATSLKKFNIRNEHMEEVPEDYDTDVKIIPAAGLGGGAAGGGTTGTGNPAILGSFTTFKNMKEGMTAKNEPYPNYMLSFDLDEENKQDVLEEIKKSNGYIEEDISEK